MLSAEVQKSADKGSHEIENIGAGRANKWKLADA
jgi:hypothetical protein